ncbi:TetR/AcrR family transcriptional regulator [Nitrincola tapanii]|uniref:TetR/AcrR family transcriptional regulator n=1 Tax=Nitrincola tapanii TaxID=1708751 RepID=A0A5A9W2P9_9GAMM|nr:TetR/AcrR family transcriptional regulator [Nitrincola tapanii]KAA0874408.1 TetR/AcrR family transcriptional regulator [Nitrincola tapanii]
MFSSLEFQPADKPAGRIRQQNEALILSAAEIEFATCGFKGASIGKIALRAGLPKANLHYYFKNKISLYIAVLSNIFELWDSTLSELRAEDEPATALREYLRQKIEFSRLHPIASRIFASEILAGAPHMQRYFHEDFQAWFESHTQVFKTWMDQGKMDRVDPAHLMFLLWSSTQHYADFAVQIAAALGKETLEDEDYEQALETLTQVLLKGCGLSP